MKLPVSDNYLSNALRDGLQVADVTLQHHHVSDLILPTGQLVACDPFVCPEAKPFNLSVPRGTFPVILSVTKSANEQRVAYAMIRFRPSTPVTWKMLTVGDQDLSTLEAGHIFGYPVDAGAGCFMDHSTASLLDQRMREEETFSETMFNEMDETYVDTWSWLNMRFGEGNLIAFSSGYGDGFYASYAGFDAEGELAIVVTDFSVVRSDDDAA